LSMFGERKAEVLSLLCPYTSLAQRLGTASPSSRPFRTGSSWNFHHLVKLRTRREVNLVNALKGYTPIEILAPPELWEPEMKTLTEQDKQRLWEEVCAEFPEDRTMQEVHFARLVHREILRGETAEDCAAFYHKEAEKAFEQSASHQQGTPA